MTKRAGWCALLLLLLFDVPAEAAKRRSVTTGGDRCQYGLLDNDAYVSSLVLDGEYAYYVDDFDLTLYRVPRNGGMREPLSTFRSVIVTDIAVDENDVYVATIPDNIVDVPPPGMVSALPKTGGSRRTIASNVIVPTQLAIDATHVYWMSGGTYNFVTETVLADGKVERIRKNGTERQTLAQDLSAPFGILLDGDQVYFSETGLATGSSSHGVRRVAKSGGTVTHVQDTHVADIIVDTGTEIVFFGGTLDLNEAGIYRVAKSGGTVQQVVEGLMIFGGPRVIDGMVYYVEIDEETFDDVLLRVPLTGGTPQVVLTDLFNQYDFEVDACGVYYGNLFGEFYKMPR